MDIDINEDTDKKDLKGIKHYIEDELAGLSLHLFDTTEIELAMDQIYISSYLLVENYVTKIISRNPQEDLLKRCKYKHLTFDQKLYIYTCHKKEKA